MAITTDERTELLDDGHEPLASEPPEAVESEEAEEFVAEDDGAFSLRYAVAVGFPTVAAGVMVGGMFIGAEARVYAVVAGLLGVAIAFALGRLRSALLANTLAVVALFAVGLVMVVPTGAENVTRVGALASDAAASGDVLRPPVPFTAGWHAIVGWLMATLGFAGAWVAIVVRRPALALLIPLPIAAIAGISVPDNAQVASGLAVLVLFGIGLGVLSSAQSVGEGERVPLGYELRRAARAVPFLAVITLALWGLSQADFLFPDPYVDPTQEPQRPKTVPLSEVEDRVLFSVQSSLSGPWRIGSLDVYDGQDWRLPPFAESELADVPRSGIVDPELPQGVKATFTVAGLEGAVLPTLPNTVGIVATGPSLAYDARNANIRVAQGQIQAGLSYTVTAAPLPDVDDLRAVTGSLPAGIRPFLEIPTPPPEIQRLLGEATSRHDNLWDRFDYVRTFVLDTVVASGAGTPVSVTPERVADMLYGSKTGSPYEIVAAQAMLARWVGVPSRIGYGFDGGDQLGNELQIRPRHGATFVEVYFPGYKWLPVIGTPKQAKPTVGGDAGLQRFDPTIQPSEDASVQLFLPVFVEPASQLGRQVLTALLIIVPTLLALGLLYVLYPWVRKAMLRARRRAAAAEAGPRARVALAYAEWRDFATDYGFRHHADTPLMFLDRFVDDVEHTELAWLVTRALWGDLQDDVSEDVAAQAEALSRSLRRRLAQSQPSTVRAVAAVSRLSLRHPYAPETDLTGKPQTQPRPTMEAPHAAPAVP